MRRILLAPLLTALVLAATVVPAAAFGAPPSAARPSAEATPTTVAPIGERLRMACAIVWDADHRGIACRWSEAKHPKAAGYVLWRSVDGGPRERVYRAGLDGPRRFFDTDVKRGQIIRYAVIVVDKDGHKIGRGGPVVVRTPRILERLRMACALAFTEDHRGVACKWSEAKRARAVGYILVRSVDGGPRERIYRTGLDGRRHFLDTDVKRGQTIRYAVIVVDKHGHKIGRGGPVVVRIPPVVTAQDALAIGSAQHPGG
jgi:hypothetical protein